MSVVCPSFCRCQISYQLFGVFFSIFFIKLQKLCGLICVNFRYFLFLVKKIVNSKIAGQQNMKMLLSCRPSSGLSNQCKFNSLCLKRTITRGGDPSTSPALSTRVGV